MTDAWRFIDTGPCGAFYNMALDEAIAKALSTGNLPPTLRIYGWDVPSVSIGYFQKVSDINIDYCLEKGIPIVRRPTGGRAILHDYEITYSFSAKTDSGIFSKGLLDSYEKISRALDLALLKIGLSSELKLQREHHRNGSPLCFQSTSYGEITIFGKKVIGSAQRRWPGYFLQQGSIPFIINENEIAKVFRLRSSEIEKKFTGLKNIFSDINIDHLKSSLRVSFEETFDTKFVSSFPTPDEVSLAEELETQRYLLPQWKYMR